jgi:hypothetical protein
VRSRMVSPAQSMSQTPLKLSNGLLYYSCAPNRHLSSKQTILPFLLLLHRKCSCLSFDTMVPEEQGVRRRNKVFLFGIYIMNCFQIVRLVQQTYVGTFCFLSDCSFQLSCIVGEWRKLYIDHFFCKFCCT